MSSEALSNDQHNAEPVRWKSRKTFLAAIVAATGGLIYVCLRDPAPIAAPAEEPRYRRFDAVPNGSSLIGQKVVFITPSREAQETIVSIVEVVRLKDKRLALRIDGELYEIAGAQKDLAGMATDIRRDDAHIVAESAMGIIKTDEQSIGDAVHQLRHNPPGADGLSSICIHGSFRSRFLDSSGLVTVLLRKIPEE